VFIGSLRIEPLRCTVNTASTPHIHSIYTASAPHPHRISTASTQHLHRIYTATTYPPHLHRICISTAYAYPPHAPSQGRPLSRSGAFRSRPASRWRARLRPYVIEAVALCKRGL
jgi:hypothetical protein